MCEAQLSLTLSLSLSLSLSFSLSLTRPYILGNKRKRKEADHIFCISVVVFLCYTTHVKSFVHKMANKLIYICYFIYRIWKFFHIFKFAYYDAIVQHFGHYATKTPNHMFNFLFRTCFAVSIKQHPFFLNFSHIIHVSLQQLFFKKICTMKYFPYSYNP